MAKTAAAKLAAVLLLGLAGCGAAGCGGGGDGPQVATAGHGASTASPGASPAGRDEKKFEDCLREHGATIDKRARSGKVTSEQMEQCRQYAPDEVFRPKFSAEDVEQLRGYARCIRAHGVPDFPDPRPDGGFPPGPASAAKGDPELRAAMEACNNQLPRPRVGSSGKAEPGGAAEPGGGAG